MGHNNQKAKMSRSMKRWKQGHCWPYIFWGGIYRFRMCCMALKKSSYLSQLVSVNTIIINNNTVEPLQILSALGALKEQL